MSSPSIYQYDNTAQYIGSKKASFSAPIIFAMCFSASLIAKFFEGAIGNGIQAGAMLLLIAFAQFCPKQFSINKIPGSFILSLSLIASATLLLGMLGGFGGIAPRYLSSSILLKSVGTLLAITAMVVTAPSYTHKDLVRGLYLFALVESSICLVLIYVGTEINPNAIAVRLSVCAMIAFALSENKSLKLIALSLCVILCFTLQCRTSLCALLGAVAFMFAERKTREHRSLIIILVPIITILLWLSLPVILESLEKVAVANLGSENFIAQFFLSDKSATKISTDMLDRSDIWEYSLEHIQEKPWLGHGLGTEQAIMGARSHNAFLSMVFEGGVFNLLAWGWFYYLTLVRLFDAKMLKRAGDVPLFYLSNLLLGYMLLAGLVETSGLASVATPINLIFLFLIIWLFSPRPQLNKV